jgi:hypothetical protein
MRQDGLGWAWLGWAGLLGWVFYQRRLSEKWYKWLSLPLSLAEPTSFWRNAPCWTAGSLRSKPVRQGGLRTLRNRSTQLWKLPAEKQPRIWTLTTYCLINKKRQQRHCVHKECTKLCLNFGRNISILRMFYTKVQLAKTNLTHNGILVLS